MSMIYIPEIGWIEQESSCVSESSVAEQFTRERFEAEKSMQIIDDHFKNLNGYVNFCKKQYNDNPDNMAYIKQLKDLSAYLGRHIGPGMIGDWSKFET
jgi:hypothetical protein